MSVTFLSKNNMGNEESQIQAQPQLGPRGSPPKVTPRGPASTAQPQKPAMQTTHELLIIVRGQRSTGKTSLINAMKGEEFSKEYEPTPFLDSCEIPFKSEIFNNEPVNIKVWDTVEKALIPPDTPDPTEYPDASTIDTFKRADGLVIVIDSRHDDTIQVADSIIEKAPIDLPILVFSNFQDEEDVNPLVPKMLTSRIGRFTFLPGSMKTGQGLIELSHWLKIPYVFSKKKQYQNLLKMTSEDLDELLRSSHETAVNFLDMETAKDHMPKIPLKPEVHKPKPTEETERRESNDYDEMPTNEAQTSIVVNPTESQKEKEPAKKQETGRKQIHRHKARIRDAGKKGENKSDKPKEAPVQPKSQPKAAAPVPENNDDFFKDDSEDDNAMVLQENDTSEEDDDNRPNPLVQVLPKKKSAPKLPTPKKEEAPKKPEPKKEPEVEENADNFFGDDDDEDDDAMKLPSDDEEEEDYAPNPLVQAASKKPAPIKTQTKVDEQKNDNDEAEENNETPSKEVKIFANKLPSPKEMPKIDDDENEDDFFGDDDDEDDDAMKLDMGNDDEEEDDEAPKVEIKKLPPLESLQPKPQPVEEKHEIPEPEPQSTTAPETAPSNEAAKEKADNLPKRHRAKLRRH